MTLRRVVLWAARAVGVSAGGAAGVVPALVTRRAGGVAGIVAGIVTALVIRAAG